MSDVYMQFPQGSNNRINGNRENVLNANRLFDSQVKVTVLSIPLRGVVTFDELKKTDVIETLNLWP